MAKQNEGFHDFADSEWRRRPRRDASGLRTERISIRVTPGEYNAIKDLARTMELTIADYVICRALSRKRRVHPDNDLTR